ncbi:Cyclin-dependent kinase G-1 [Dichanthelium oligosanthes]|uniref:Cyclin-dependent kinase G-1 n=1 Tax=Dichanthelium oligosanthes TaxID=888268 RepID=A0A1E5WFG5_9POAL|nr:Cyclin-dependent kinase G-1 [Dichanthelium oligosanthes]
MAAARHAGYRSLDVARGRERDLERFRRSKEYDHRRRHPSRDRDGGHSRSREVPNGHTRHGSPYRPRRSQPSRREEDREPGEVSSGSGSEESGGLPLKARVPREDGVMGVCKDGSALSPSKKRKHSPVIPDANVSKLQAIDDVRSRGRVDTAVAELPLPSLPPLSGESPMGMVGGCPTMNLDVSMVSREAERSHEHEKDGIMEGEEDCPTMRNIFTSRWADADEEEEVIVPKKKRSVSPANLSEQRSTKKVTSPELGEALRAKTSRGSSSDLSNSMGSENWNIEVDEGDCMDVENENGIDASAGCLRDAYSGVDARRSRTPEVVRRPRRCFNMLQGCRSIDEFERINTINEGTYGVVFRVRDKKTDEIVALKKIKMNNEREGFPLTSLREINILLSFDHPSIVDVKEVVVGGHDDDTFMVMEYMEHDLKGVMETMKQPYTQSEVKCLMLQLLEGVKYLHDNWVLHRDLKTSNLLLNNRGELKICDFGLSRQYGSPLKPYTQPVVTLWYRAPELLLGAKEYSTAIDMWSLGCIMAELLSKEPLFTGKNEIGQLAKIFGILGTPNEERWHGYSKLPGAKGKFVKQPYNRLREKFPAVSFTGGLTLSEAGFDLLNRFLTYDPEKRISADDALNHEWFHEVPLPKTKDFMPTFPALNEQDRRIKKYMKSPDPLVEQQMKEQGSTGHRGLFG